MQANPTLLLLAFLISCGGTDDDTGSLGSDAESPSLPDDASEPEDEPGASSPPAANAGSVEDACGTDSYGYGSPSAAAIEALERTNCYRNLMAIELGTLDVDVDRASQAHADYMERNDTLTHYEDPSAPGYTGEWVWDRIETAGFDRAAGQSWAEVVSWGTSPESAVDMWVGSVYHRIPFTMPYWIASGFGQSGDYSAMSFVTPYPDGPRAAVVFPVHGQTDVPPTFDSDTEWPDPAPDHGVVGYPISVTVAAPNIGPDGANPYNTVLIAATLEDDAGRSLPVIAIDPSGDDHMSVMAAIVPIDPLAAVTTYTATLTVEWDGAQETFVTTFTTGN